MKVSNKSSFWLPLELMNLIPFIFFAYQSAPAATAEPTIIETPSLAPSPESDPIGGCSAVKCLSNDSIEAQQVLEEFIQNFKKEHPTEYMGMAVLDRVDRLGEWAVVQGSVSGDDRNILVVHRTSQEYQLVEEHLVVPAMEEDEGSNKRITQYFLEKVPDAPEQLLTCLEQTCFLGREARPTEPPHAYQLVYTGTDNGNTDGITEVYAIPFDGSEPRLILSAPMMINELVLSSDGEQFAFWGCPGSIAFDCVPPEEDLDVWAVNWDGSRLRNLTEGSVANDAHLSWSPDSKQIVFYSNRSGNPQLYIMNADGSSPKPLTDDALQNTEPKWSSDGKWIAYYCRQGFDIQICVISPDGQPAWQPISGTEPVWSPLNREGGVHLAFLCFKQMQSDICMVEPDGSNLINLTNNPAYEHSPAWSLDGNWVAFVSNWG